MRGEATGYRPQATGSGGLNSGTRNAEPGTQNPNPGTRNPELETRNPEPRLIFLVEVFCPGEKRRGYHCAMLGEPARGGLALHDVRVLVRHEGVAGAVVREGTVELSGLPYIVSQVPIPVWWEGELSGVRPI